MNKEHEQVFIEIVRLLDDNHCLPHVLVIGSWAEYLYLHANILPEEITVLHTQDLDFLVRNLHKPSPPVNLPALAISNGYSISEDIITGTTKILSTHGLEVEFLIGQKGKGTKPILKTALGVNAQALRHMDILLEHSRKVDFMGMAILVPTPEAYVLHKIIINEERKKEKQEKDIAKIKNLFPHIDENKFASLRKKITAKEEQQVAYFLQKHNMQYYTSTLKEKLQKYS